MALNKLALKIVDGPYAGKTLILRVDGPVDIKDQKVILYIRNEEGNLVMYFYRQSVLPGFLSLSVAPVEIEKTFGHLSRWQEGISIPSQQFICLKDIDIV